MGDLIEAANASESPPPQFLAFYGDSCNLPDKNIQPFFFGEQCLQLWGEIMRPAGSTHLLLRSWALILCVL